MNRRKRAVLLVVVVGCGLLLAGCFGGEGLEEPPENVTASEVEADALAAMGNVDSARIDLEITVEGNQGELLTATSETVVDRQYRRMRTDGSAEPLLQDPIELTQYTINETVYTRTGGEWTRTRAGMGVWDQDPIGLYEEMLASGETELLGVTTFDGSEVYVLETGIDAETLAALVGQATPDSGPVEASALDDLTVEQYVDTETNHIRHVELEVETSQLPTEGRATISLTSTLSGFNEPVDVELPAPAAGG